MCLVYTKIWAVATRKRLEGPRLEKIKAEKNPIEGFEEKAAISKRRLGTKSQRDENGRGKRSNQGLGQGRRVITERG